MIPICMCLIFSLCFFQPYRVWLDSDELNKKISARIAELRTEMERYIIQANQQVAAYQAVIAELEKLISPFHAPE